MTTLKRSASAPSFASIALPRTNVIAMPVGSLNTPRPKAFTRISVGRMRCPTGKQEIFFGMLIVAASVFAHLALVGEHGSINIAMSTSERGE